MIVYTSICQRLAEYISERDIFRAEDVKSKSKSHYDRQSVGQSVLVSGTRLGPVTNFSFSLKFSLDSCGFVIL
jgi:hypothetical protein